MSIKQTHMHTCTHTHIFFVCLLFYYIPARKILKGVYNCNEYYRNKLFGINIWHFNSNLLQVKGNASEWNIMENQ